MHFVVRLAILLPQKKKKKKDEAKISLTSLSPVLFLVGWEIE